ncbi:MAG: CapA family protein, partial [Gammaproteobacteria bacterium]|nr:CapA family protein [Gemmatimonadota bacterium]NIU75900.1 CapA family protein [Gammaproteobacteria bacterium]
GVAPALARLATGARLVANVANNHAMDAGASGFRSTVRHLEAAGILVTGADTLAAMVPQPTGDTLAFLGFATAQAGPDPRNLAAVERHVRRAAGPGRRVIVTMHMGAEGRGAQRTRDRRERFLGEDRGNAVAFARTAVDAGAEAVIGHGPHVLRAVEWIGDAFVAYSLGNLLTY